jgi:hypothetical protein
MADPRVDIAAFADGETFLAHMRASGVPDAMLWSIALTVEVHDAPVLWEALRLSLDAAPDDLGPCFSAWSSCRDEPEGLVPYWPEELDELCLALAEARHPWLDREHPDLPGILLARRRTEPTEPASAEHLRRTARAVVHQVAAGRLPRDATLRTVVGTEPIVDAAGQPTDAFLDTMHEILGAHWPDALADALASGPSILTPRICLPAWRDLPAREAARRLAHAVPDPDIQRTLDVLASRPPADLVLLANANPDLAHACVLAAQPPLPRGLTEHLQVDAWHSDEDHARIEARLVALPLDVRDRLVRRALDRDTWDGALRAARHASPAVRDDILGRLRQLDDRPPLARGRAVQGLADWIPEHADDLIRAAARHRDATTRAVLSRATVLGGARLARQGQALPAALDHLLDLHHHPAQGTPDPVLDGGLVPDLLEVLTQLPAHRVEAVVLDQIDPMRPTSLRALPLVAAHPFPDAVDAAAEAMLQQVEALRAIAPARLTDWLIQLGDRLVPALDDAAPFALHGDVARAYLDALLIPQDTLHAKLERYLRAHPDAPTLTVHDGSGTPLRVPLDARYLPPDATTDLRNLAAALSRHLQGTSSSTPTGR